MKYKYNDEWVDLSIKALDSMPVGTQVEYTGTDIPTGWEEVNDYSTTETYTGKKWIDGSKIYRKVYSNTNYSQNASTTADVTFALTNLDTIISVSGSAYFNNTHYVMPNSMWSNTSGMQYSWNVNGITSTGFKILTGSSSSISSAKIYVVFEYTKTTD